MKQTFLFSLLVICLSLAMSSCGNKPETTTDGQTMTADSTGANAAVTTMSANEHAGAPVAGQAHYKCTKAGCTGTGDAAGKCPVCGTDLEHNAAFHGTPASPGATPGATPQTAVTLDPATGKPAITPVAGSATPPPAKNEAGVYHFACSKAGCDGGAAAAGKCPKCGGDLAHNPAYHNK